MKKLVFIFSVIISVANVQAQKVKVQTAFNHLKYDELDKAKEAIDEAANNEQTKTMAKTWFYRGLIYQAMYKHKTFGNLDPNPPAKAFESYKKSLEIEPKGEFSDDINSRIYLVAFYKGVEEYKVKNYVDAMNSFDFVIAHNPKDTLAILYGAYSADYGKNPEKSVACYKKLIDMSYKDLEPEKTNIFLELATLYKRDIKDTAKALEYVVMGRQKYPAANNLIREEANIYLQTGRNKEAIDRLELAINKTPGDFNLYLVLASLYDNMAGAEFKNKKADSSNVHFAKAEANYKKAIELSPDFFDAYYNLGAMFFNLGAEMANAANDLKSDKEYQAAKVKADAKLKEALPYLEKANTINPKDKNTLLSLKQLYVRTGDTDKYNKVKLSLDNLK